MVSIIILVTNKESAPFNGAPLIFFRSLVALSSISSGMPFNLAPGDIAVYQKCAN